MPFRMINVPEKAVAGQAWQPAYVDVSQVTDPKHGRLEVGFENGMTVMLKLPKDASSQNVLEVDKANSDASALEECYYSLHFYKTKTLWDLWRYTYRMCAPWNRGRFEPSDDEPQPRPKRQRSLTMDDVRKNAIITVDLEFNRLHLRSPAIGMPLGARIAMPDELSYGYYPVAGGIDIVSIESVVVE
jgi:hypothetical protein